MADQTIADIYGDFGGLRLPRELVEARPRQRQGAARLYRRLVAGFVAGDAIAIGLAALICRTMLPGGRAPVQASSLLLGLAPFVGVAVLASSGLYRIAKLSPADEFRRIISAVGLSGVVLGLVADAGSRLLLGRPDHAPLTVVWLGAYWLLALVLVMSARKVLHRVIHRLRRSGVLLFRTVIIGANDEGYELARRMKNRGTGMQTVGMMAVNGERPQDGTVADVPLLGTIDSLSGVLVSEQIDCVFIASSAMRPESVTRVLQVARRLNVDVRVSANMPEILASRLSVQPVGNTLALSLQTANLSGVQAFIKRMFDIFVAGLTLLLTSPVLLVSAVLIRATSRGPILFRQKRVGRAGELFRIYKFRTMSADADEQVHALIDLSADQGPLLKIKDDPRITRVGRFLRKWSIDELPQLLNVIKGDMSLVGPRPMPATFDQGFYEDWHLQRLEVLPGITGLWQVSGRSGLTFDECVQLDLFYIENWSVSYDLFILLKTIPAVILGRGAY